MGRYSAIASLGQGGMANIYLALMAGPARFNKLLVLKVLREDIETNREELAAMFLDEARLAARLQHRNIVQTYEFGEIQGQYYMAMEYLDGKPLRALQRKLAPLPLEEELRILADTAHGVHYAHELVDLHGQPLEVVHRDVSPQNVFVTYDGQVKLLDFGIAKMAGAEHLTQVGVIKGKIDYIAPEQVRGDKVDRRADVFSLGAMLWEAITGERFGGGTKISEVTKFHNRLTGGEPKLRELKPDVPEALATIVDEAIALDPANRMPSAAVFAERIEGYLATLPNKPSERSLAALLATPFQEERAQLRKIIDQQCKKILESTMTGASRTGLDLRLVKVGGPDLSMPATGSSAYDAPIPASLATTDAGRRAPRWRSPALLGSSGIAIAVAVLFALNGKPPSTQAGAAVDKGPQAPAPALPAAPQPEPTAALPAAATVLTERSVKLVVEVSPREAHALLDNVPLPSLPFSGNFEMSGALHRLEVSAEGYQPARQFVTFDRDQNIKIELRAFAPVARGRAKRSGSGAEEPARTAPAESAPSQPPASARTDDPAPGAPLRTTPRSRGFDMQDPYAE